MPGAKKPPTGPLNNAVSRLIDAALRESGRTRAQLAAGIGVHASQATRLLQNDRPWDVDQVERACTFLGLDVAQVVADAEMSVKAATILLAVEEADARGERADFDLAAYDDVDDTAGEFDDGAQGDRI